MFALCTFLGNVKTAFVALMLFAVPGICFADSKTDNAKNMCEGFAKDKPAAQRDKFIADCVRSMVTPQTAVVFPDTDPINIPIVMADGKAWVLSQLPKSPSATFRDDRLVKYTRHRPSMSIAEAKAQGLRIIPNVVDGQFLIYCGEFSTDGLAWHWFAVPAKTETVGRKGTRVEFVPSPVQWKAFEDAKGVCISGVRLS